MRCRKRRYRKPLQKEIARNAIGMLCIACVISNVLVLTGVRLLYKHSLSSLGIHLAYFVSCGLTIYGGIKLMIFRTKKLVDPILSVRNMVEQVAKGEFHVRIPYERKPHGAYEYENELEELVEHLNKMAAELEGMDYMQKDFMNNVSHEVKTPVSAITGFTEILLDGDITKEEQEEYLQLVNQESLRLATLCENMLKMSRLDMQELVKKEEGIRLDEQLRKVVILLAEKWEERQMEFDLDLMPITICSDGDLLMQVWMNLIDNAIKYSKKMSTITIRAEEEEEWVAVTIADQGEGTHPAKLGKIYDRFYQCEESHKKKGNGLGLSIVKRILELVEGTIQVESQEGVGTKVIISLPKGRGVVDETLYKP